MAKQYLSAERSVTVTYTQPEYFESNDHRANRARLLVDAYRDLFEARDEPADTVLVDLLSDLLHLADRVEAEPGEMLTAEHASESAWRHYTEEVADEVTA